MAAPLIQIRVRVRLNEIECVLAVSRNDELNTEMRLLPKRRREIAMLGLDLGSVYVEWLIFPLSDQITAILPYAKCNDVIYTIFIVSRIFSSDTIHFVNNMRSRHFLWFY